MTHKRTLGALAAGLLLTLLAGCAGGEETAPVPTPDENSANNTNNANNANNTNSDTNNANNTAEPDLQDEPDVVEEPDITEEPDVVEEPDVPEEPPCGACCPGERRCMGELTAQTCKADGSGWEDRACSGGATCVQGACIVQCEPGVSVCLDAQTLQTCDVSGASYTNRRCNTGICLDGECRTGELNGAACEADDACAGGECLCRGQEVCNPALASTFGATGYCTVPDCSALGCGQDEVCADFGRTGALTGRPVCVKKCFDCLQQDFICRELPTLTDGQRGWAEGCFPDLWPVNLAGRCANDADCLGGLCLTGELGPGDGPGYCTQACESDAECPASASCLALERNDEPVGSFCIPKCGDGSPGNGECAEDRGIYTGCAIKINQARRQVYACLPRWAY